MESKNSIPREEFDAIINEFESFRDMMMDSVAKLTTEIEILKDDVKEIRQSLSDSKNNSKSQKKLL